MALSEANDKTIHDLVQEAEYGARRMRGAALWIAGTIAVGMSLFQFYTAGVRVLPAEQQRSIHLTFVMLLCFLYYPLGRRSPRQVVPWYDWILALLAASSVAYTFVFFDQIARRVGTPTRLDMLFGILAVLFVLEVARRVIGFALPLLSLAFISYAFLGPYMPDLIMHRGYTLRRVLDQLYMTMEGIYGVPVGVSATFVFAFVLFGAVLERIGAGQYLIDLAFAVLGHYRGGPAKAAVVSSGVFGMVSGSSIANVVTTGTFTIPLMKKVGFRPEVAGAVESAASTHGQLMPPVMGAAAFVMAEFTGIPYVKIALAAFIPAFISYVGLFTAVHLEAVKYGLQGIPRDQLPRFWATLVGGLHYLVSIGVLIYYLIWELASPMTSAFNATVVAMLTHLAKEAWLSVRREGSLGAVGRAVASTGKQVNLAFEAAARNMVGISAACACAGIIIGMTTLTGLGLRISEVIVTLAGGNLFLTLVLAMLASIVLGMGIPTTPTYIMMAALTAPAILAVSQAQQLAISLLAAHLFVFYYGIVADDTPPVGVAAYAGAGLAGADPWRTGLNAFKLELRTFLLPFMFIYNPLLLGQGVTWANGHELVWATLTGCLGMYAFSVVIQAHFLVPTRWWEWLLMLATSLLLIKPGLITDLIGFGLFALVFVAQRQRHQRVLATSVASEARSVP